MPSWIDRPYPSSQVIGNTMLHGKWADYGSTLRGDPCNPSIVFRSEAETR